MTVYRNNPLLMTVMGANPGRRHRPDPDDDDGGRLYCRLCDGHLAYLGGLGNLDHYRCVDCGQEFSVKAPQAKGNPGPRMTEKNLDRLIGAAWHRLMSGIQVPIMDIPRIFRDIKLEIAAGMPVAEAVMRVGERYRVQMNGRRQRNPVRRNPTDVYTPFPRTPWIKAITVVGNEWDARDRAKSLGGIHSQQFRPHDWMGRYWTVYFTHTGRQVTYDDVFHATNVETDAARSVRSNPSLAASLAGAGVGAMVTHALSNPRPRRAASPNPQPNPGPRGKRKIVMTIEKFAQWVKAKKDPAMWRAFIQKFKGYEKWTHGARSRKVVLEWQDVPGITGLWITYNAGKAPETTYIMPGGVPRKGAWKHPWDTMPELRHDAEAGIVIQKLRGKSRITDFYHK